MWIFQSPAAGILELKVFSSALRRAARSVPLVLCVHLHQETRCHYSAYLATAN